MNNNQNNGYWNRERRLNQNFNRENRQEGHREYPDTRSPQRERCPSREDQNRQGQERRMHQIQTRNMEPEGHRSQETPEEAGSSQNFH